MGVRGNLGLEFAHRCEAQPALRRFGGVAPNPTLDLIHLLAEMVDRDGKLLVPGAGYADVKITPSEAERREAHSARLAGVEASIGVSPR